MRTLVNLNKHRQRLLAEQFPDVLGLESCSGNFGYKRIAISVFDHWLSRSEANELLNNIDAAERERRNKIHRFLNEKIISSTSCLTYKIKGRLRKRHPIFKRFANSRSASNYVKPNDNSISSNYYFRLVLPELEAIYYEGSDDTNYLYYKEEALLADFFEWVEECGLNIIK